eukprot:m.209329 g.209329  ORF g.209329 m.209329 type:complete len:250 (+) comp15467_c0_seq3:3737-4486(+)
MQHSSCTKAVTSKYTNTFTQPTSGGHHGCDPTLPTILGIGAIRFREWVGRSPCLKGLILSPGWCIFRLRLLFRILSGAVLHDRYGRGPHESYVDRNRSARLGQWGGVVREQLFPYVRPQETGNKVDVRWIGVSSTTKSIGIVAFVDHTMTPLSASALDVDEYDLDGGFVKSQQHAAEVVHKNQTILHIDFRQTGLGGIDSWGRGPLDEYQIALPRRGLSYSFWLRPYRGSAEDAGDYVTDTPPCFGCIK